MNTQYINLNMTPSGVLPVLHCSQYDIGRPLGVVVYDGSAEMDLDDYTVTIEATRTDGTAITAAVTTDENIGAFVTTATMTNKEDLYPAQLVIVDGSSNRVASLPFMMRVVKAAMDENSEAVEEDASLYQQYTSTVKSLISTINANLNAEIAARETADAAMQSSIASESAARASADTILSDRMDTFTSLPSGSTAGDAELMDIRVGYDGITYGAAGTAVRTQVGDLADSIGNILSITPILTTTWTSGNIANTGASTTTNSRIRIAGTKLFQAAAGDIIEVLPPYRARVAAYPENVYNSSSLIGFIQYDYASGLISIPDTYAGKYIGIALLDSTQESADISGAIPTIGNYVKYYRVSGLDKRIDDAETAIENNKSLIYEYNSVDAFALFTSSETTTRDGITYTKNADGTWTITGTSTDISFCNLISAAAALPDYIIAGRKYRLILNGGTVPVQVFLYNADGSSYVNYTNDSIIEIPSNTTGIIVRFRLDSGVTVDETVRYQFISGGGSGGGGTYYNTYNITTSPTITTDTNGWLQAIDTESEDETGKTDMTGAIMSMLTDTGYCHLGEGIFYVSGNIDMPAHSTLCGCGNKTVIRLLSSVPSGYIVKMQEYCTVKDIAFSGSYSTLTPTLNGGRDAIRFTANYDGNEGASSYTTQHCMIDNVWIRNFSGSGIYCHNSSISVSKGLYVTNAFILRCYAGINIDYYSEFNKFTNICTASCYYGVINNGGNNVFTSCTFHATNTGFYIDGSQPNAAHGTINGCTFCHIGSNNGVAFKGDAITAGFIIANCQIWYNSVELTNCQGVLFDGCEFGRGITNDGDVCASITVSGGNLVMFSGCIFHLDVTRPPKITITNNTKTVFSGCYGTESGSAITA